MAENRSFLAILAHLANIPAITLCFLRASLPSPNSAQSEVAIAIFDGNMVEMFVELVVVSCFDVEDETGVSEWRVRLAYAVI